MNEHVGTRLDVRGLRSLMDASEPKRRGAVAYRRGFKRILDVVLVLAALPVTLALLVPLMAIIALDGRSPIYVQKRIGKGGRVFRMFKLRSMVAGADQILEDYLERNPVAREEWDLTQKLKADPRITGFGAFIRKTSLDEVPQLFNVLIGDMSLVGPRPMMVQQKELYPGAAYYEMRPGITGFWQISERNESSFAERAGFDTAYFRRVSLLTDMKVMAETVKVVFRATGY